MNKKFENTRVVTVKEDFKGKNGKVLLAKGSVHSMHVVTANKLKDRGAKIEIKEFDHKAAIAKAKEARAQREDDATKNMWKKP